MLLMKNQWFAELPPPLRFGWKAHLSMVELKRGDSLTPDKYGETVFSPSTASPKFRGNPMTGSTSFSAFQGQTFLLDSRI
jgi:hypothetical protein